MITTAPLVYVAALLPTMVDGFPMPSVVEAANRKHLVRFDSVAGLQIGGACLACSAAMDDIGALTS